MKKLGLLLVGLLCLSVVVYAGDVITNDTGEDATGLRVSFSTPVLITAFGDILTSVDPQMLSFEFVFSGGTVKPWGSHWFNYAPATANVMETEWLTGSIVSDIPQGSLTREDLLNLGRAPTYEEIMSVIAEYPGEDEPLYEPASDEAVWLTDLEGHADIYDNDSIKINYADWFDRSQISRIEIRRNGIKMRFLPDMLDVDVLTNEQMKTFDGNPLEHTPASDHTDHTTIGYQYAVWIYGEPSLTILTATIESPFRFTGEKIINIGIGPDVLIDPEKPDQRILEILLEAKSIGFETAQFGNRYYVLTNTANEIHSEYDLASPMLHCGETTLTDDEVRRMLRLIDEAGMNAQCRIELWLSEEYKQNHPGQYGWDSANLQPSDIDKWFESYTALCRHMGALLEEGGGDTLVVASELVSLEKYKEHWEEVAHSVRDVFSGRVTHTEATHFALAFERMGDFELGGHNFATAVGAFWNAYDLIQMNTWPLPDDWYQFETQVDQRLSILTERFATFWRPAVVHYRNAFPTIPLYFGEAGVFKADGVSTGIPGLPHVDLQEFTDFWVAMLAASEYFGLDGIAVWTYDLDDGPWLDGPAYRHFNRMTTLQTIAAIFGEDVSTAISLLRPGS